MKAQIGRGRGQKGLLAYAFQGHKNGEIEKGARLIGGTCSGSTLEEIQAEFAAVRKLRPDIERPAWHCSLSLKPPERLTDEQWAHVADKYMRGMGFGDKSLYAVVRHSDTEHDHIHIVASRTGLDGKIYLGQKEAARSMPLTNEIAREFGLSELAHDTRAEVKGITAGEKSMMDRTESIPIRIMLQTYIDDATQGKPSFAEFVAKLEAQGVTVIPSGKTGQAQGMTFELDGVPFTGTKLGDRFKWKPLQAQLDYNPERDQPILDRLRAQAAKPETTGELTNTTITNQLRWTDPGPRTSTGNRTLDIAFDKTENGVYKWKSRDTVAITDHGNRISVHSRAESAVRASLQLSKGKGWESVKATGSEEFKRLTWLIGSEMGLAIQGYEPSKSDREELKQRLAAKEAKYGKNNRNTEAGRGQHDRDQDRSRAGRDAGEHSHKLQSDSRRPGSEDRGGSEGNGRARQQDRMAIELQTSGSAGASDSRSPDLADDISFIANRSDISSIRNAAVQVADLAAPILQDRRAEQESRAERPDNLQSITKDHAAKIAAWRAQHAALGALAYRITLVDRDPERIAKHGRMGLGYVLGKKTGHDIKTPGEVEAAISTLRRENARKFDIYITPIDDKNHYLLIDDIHEEKAGKLRKFKADGFTPALIQFSSNDNFQAILKVPKIDGDHDFANQIFQKLNTDYGEPGIKGGVVHPFRMVGFANKKPGKSGFTKLIDANPGAICEKTSELIKFAMENHDAEKKAREVEKEKTRRLQAIENHNQMPLNPGSNDAVLRAYQKSFNRTLGLAKQKGWTIDYSRIDFAASKDLIKQGYQSEALERAITIGSPSLELRKGQHMADYARLTVQKVMVSNDVIQHKARAEAQQAQRSGPRL
jgi:hypothetical protein